MIGLTVWTAWRLLKSVSWESYERKRFEHEQLVRKKTLLEPVSKCHLCHHGHWERLGKTGNRFDWHSQSQLSVSPIQRVPWASGSLGKHRCGTQALTLWPFQRVHLCDSSRCAGYRTSSFTPGAGFPKGPLETESAIPWRSFETK